MAMLTITDLAVRAARTNPVDAVRYEEKLWCTGIKSEPLYIHILAVLHY